MIMQTNPGVIEQYERRQAEVCLGIFVILRRTKSCLDRKVNQDAE